MTLVKLNDVSLARNGDTILSGITLTLSRGDRTGVVGPNGVGKSTLIAAIAGDLLPVGGSIRRYPSSLRVAHVRQELAYETAETVRALIARRTGVTAANQRFERATMLLEATYDDRTMTVFTEALEEWQAVGGHDFDTRMAIVLDRVGLGSERSEQMASSLSGGQAARVELAVTLLTTAPVLLLDEPTNDLDVDGIELLESNVLLPDRAVLFVSHDRRFLENVATSVFDIDENTKKGAYYPTRWTEFLHLKSVQRERNQRLLDQFEDERARLHERVQREQQWATRGQSSGRSDKDKIAKGKAAASAQARGAQARRTAEKLERLVAPADQIRDSWELRLAFPEIERSGDVVADLSGVCLSRGTFCLGPLDLRIGFRERVLFSGGNGAGKSSLLALILGEALPTSGTVRVGSGVVPGVLSQSRSLVQPNRTLLHSVLQFAGGGEEAARSSLAKLGLSAADVFRLGGEVSPGQRTRAVLAAFQLRGVNLMVLDEPTNHLDMPAIEQLEKVLETYSGTLLLVTHDRAFRERVSIDRHVRVESGQLLAGDD